MKPSHHSHPVSSSVAIKVSAEFAEVARAAARAADRSLTGQLEHWAKLGRAAESILPVPTATALKQSAGCPASLEDASLREQILAALGDFRELPVDEKRARLGLGSRLRFEPDPANSNGVIRIAADGTRTHGTLHGRTFTPLPA